MAEQNDAMADGSSRELPEIERIESGESTATAYFENGAKLRYTKKDDGYHEQVFAPSDPDSVMEDLFVTSGPETAANILAESLDVYDMYETVAELQKDWESLAEWIVHE